MGLEFNFVAEDDLKRDWLRLLAFIKAERTHEPAFQALFDNLLEDHNHPYYHQALTLKMFYDFTPLAPLSWEKEEEPNPSESDQASR
ncbi:MAG: hypothetical protein AAFR61_06895 [Bacteroidota bacterium]